uniref:Uncharacterized protein n=1 Tax=Zea mays TaxID=4577 RepID=C0PE00_MAIZE|nr:unknown [Zea mays]
MYIICFVLPLKTPVVTRKLTQTHWPPLRTCVLDHQGAPREGAAREGRHDAEPVLPGGIRLQLRLLRLPGLPVPDAHLPVVALLGVPALRGGAAAGVGAERAGRGRGGARLVHHLLLPRKPARQPLVRHRQRGRRLRPHHVRHHARRVLLARPVRGAQLPHLLRRALHRRRADVQHLQHRGLQLPVRHRGIRAQRPALPQHLLRRHLRGRLRVPHRHGCARLPLPRERDLAAEQVSVPREEGGRAHEADEEVQAGPRVVVHLHPRRQRRRHHIRLRVLHRAAPAALVGRPARLRHRLLLHPPDRDHHSDDEPDSRPEHHHRIHHGVPVPGPSRRQHVLQGVRLHQHDAGAGLPARLQAGPLHEDPAEDHVHGAGGGDADRGARVHRDGVVAHGQRPQHLQHGAAPRRQPLDVPHGPRVLRRVRHLGPHRPAQDLRRPRHLLGGQLVLPGRRRRAPPRVARAPGVPEPELDPARQHARAHRLHRHDAAGHRRQLHHVDHCRVPVGVRGLQVPASLVGAPQLPALWRARRWPGVHGRAHLPVLGLGERRPQLVGQ